MAAPVDLEMTYRWLIAAHRIRTCGRFKVAEHVAHIRSIAVEGARHTYVPIRLWRLGRQTRDQGGATGRRKSVQGNFRAAAQYGVALIDGRGAALRAMHGVIEQRNATTVDLEATSRLNGAAVRGGVAVKGGALVGEGHRYSFLR